MIITNPFTGEKKDTMAKPLPTELENALAKDSELIEANPERPGILRARSIGRTYNFEPSLTDQSGKDDCNLKRIWERYQKTGNLTELMKRGDINQDTNRYYGDFSQAKDYQQSINIVIHAQDQFMNLDAPVRKEFDNDPGKFLEFINNPANKDRIEKLGLTKPKTVKGATLDDVVNAIKAPKEPQKPAGKGGEA
jgi:phage internal scaffolding protein